MGEIQVNLKGTVVAVPASHPKFCHRCKFGLYSNKDDRWYCGAGDPEFDPDICKKAFVDIGRKELIG